MQEKVSNEATFHSPFASNHWVTWKPWCAAGESQHYSAAGVGCGTAAYVYDSSVLAAAVLACCWSEAGELSCLNWRKICFARVLQCPVSGRANVLWRWSDGSKWSRAVWWWGQRGRMWDCWVSVSTFVWRNLPHVNQWWRRAGQTLCSKSRAAVLYLLTAHLHCAELAFWLIFMIIWFKGWYQKSGLYGIDKKTVCHFTTTEWDECGSVCVWLCVCLSTKQDTCTAAAAGPTFVNGLVEW